MAFLILRDNEQQLDIVERWLGLESEGLSFGLALSIG